MKVISIFLISVFSFFAVPVEVTELNSEIETVHVILNSNDTECYDFFKY